jgi:hypothetical protein
MPDILAGSPRSASTVPLSSEPIRVLFVFSTASSVDSVAEIADALATQGDEVFAALADRSGAPASGGLSTNVIEVHGEDDDPDFETAVGSWIEHLPAEARELRVCFNASVEAVTRALPVSPAVLSMLSELRPDVVVVSPPLSAGTLGRSVLRATRRLAIPVAVHGASDADLATTHERPDELITSMAAGGAIASLRELSRRKVLPSGPDVSDLAERLSAVITKTRPAKGRSLRARNSRQPTAG